MEMILVQAESLSGRGINWALFRATYGYEHEVNSVPNENIVVHTPDKCLFEPLTNWSQLGPLLKKYEVQFFVEDLRNLWQPPDDSKLTYRATASTREGGNKHHSIASGPDHETAACRAILRLLLGDEFRIPACYIQGELVAC